MNLRESVVGKRKKLLVLGCVALLLCCCVCTISSLVIYSNSSPSLQLTSPSTNNMTLDVSKIKIKLNCLKIDKLSLNENALSRSAKSEICLSGKDYDLNEGENIFEFQGTNDKGETKPEYLVKLKITYTKKVEQAPVSEPVKVPETKVEVPAPKQYKTIEEWVDVTTFSGSSSTKTEPFTINGKRWKVIYTLEPQNNYQSFTAYVYKPGASIYSDSITMFAEQNGESTLYSKGEFYLDVTSANTGWTVRVQQLVDKQIEI